MPPYDACPLTYMLDVLAGRKLALDQSQITHYKVPRFDELSLEALLEEIKDDEEMQKYLPEITAESRKTTKASLCPSSRAYARFT